MASFEGLPNEMVIAIIERLCDDDRKIHHFDPVGVKDLQHVRLSSRRMSKLAAPLLFENMILDEKLLDDEDLARISNFAEGNPHLARHVRRLQRRLSPLVINAQHTRAEYTEQAFVKGLDGEGLLSLENEGRLLNSLGDQFGVQTAFDKVQPCCHKSRTSFLRPIRALPNLLHLDNTVSEHHQTRLKAIARQSGAKTAWLLEEVWNRSHVFGPMAPLVHLYSHSPELTTPTIKSLKVVEMPLPSRTIDGWSNSLLYLQHLDIECRLTSSRFLDPEEADPELAIEQAGRWRSEIQNLTNLRSLRLRGTGNWKTALTARSVYVDDFLHGVQLPRLNSLSLVNWPVREIGLAKIIRQHRESLTSLEFRRISIEVTQMGPTRGVTVAWRRIAAFCAQCSDVERFSFRELKVHDVSGQAIEAPPLFGDERVQAHVKGIRDYYRIARGLLNYGPTPLDAQ